MLAREQVPIISALIQDVTLRDGYQTCQGIAIPIAASAIHAGSDGSYEGRFHDAFDGCIHGGATPINVTTSLTSSNVKGSPILPSSTAPYYSPYTGAIGTAWMDGRFSAEIGGTLDMAASHDSHLVEIVRGMYPPDATVPMKESNFYTDLILIDGSTTLNFKIHIPAVAPIKLMQTNNGGTTWRTVQVLAGTPDGEAFLQQHGRRLLIQIRPEYGDGVAPTLRIELNNGYIMRVSPVDEAGYPVALPSLGPFRIEGKAGMATICRYPLRFAPVKVMRTVKPYQTPASSSPGVSVNGRGRQGATQTNSTNVVDNGNGTYTFSVQSSHPDDGLGNGSILPPVVADVTFLMPFEWSDSGIPGNLAPFAEMLLYAVRVEIDEYLDDVSRTTYSLATIYFNNRTGFFNDSFGHRAIDISIGNKGTLVPYFSGIGGVGQSGMELINTPEGSMAVMHCQCASVKLQDAVKCGRQYDLWALPDAVRWEAQLGQMHPKYLSNIPTWNQNGGTVSRA